jgi:hypothetical protein
MASKAGCLLVVLFAGLVSGAPCRAQTPDPARSYYVPEAGPVGTPFMGTDATKFFRACPGNDGGSSLPQSARIKVVLKNAAGDPIIGLAAANIYIKLNGGTAVQGFPGDGADSVIANGIYNNSPACPLLQYMTADAASDGSGVAYITFGGGDPANPGTSLPDAGRKWGHYDSVLPVYANGVLILGRLVEGSGSIGDYVLRIKSFDFKGGLANGNNQGEVVSSVDFNSEKGSIGSTDPLSYWQDFDSGGSVTVTDLNMLTAHVDHDCGTPMSP